MEIPLVLRARGGSSLVYGIPAWYRAAVSAILAVVAGALFLDGSPPGPLGWIFLGLLVLALLYEERWDFDAGRKELRHRFGLLVAARTLRLPFDAIESLALVPWVRGTLPGSADEASENAAALARSRGRSGDAAAPLRRRSFLKQPYLGLVCEGEERLLLSMVPAGRGAGLRADGVRIAEFCGKPFVEG